MSPRWFGDGTAGRALEGGSRLRGRSVHAYRGTLVVAVDTGAVVGRLESLVVDFETRSVAGFVLREGPDGEGARLWGSIELIRSFGDDALILESRHGLYDGRGAPELVRLRTREREAYRKPVLTVTGQKVGRILDTMVDEKGQVVAFELFSESHFDKVFRGVLLLSDDVIFGEDVILVPARPDELLVPFADDDGEGAAPRGRDPERIRDEGGADRVLTALPGAGSARALPAALAPSSSAGGPVPLAGASAPVPASGIRSIAASSAPSASVSADDAGRPSLQPLPDPSRRSAVTVMPQIFPELESLPGAAPADLGAAPTHPEAARTRPGSDPAAEPESAEDGAGAAELPDDLPPGVDRKLVGFVLGRTASRALTDHDGAVLVEKGSTIDLDIVLRAHELDLMPKLFLAATTTMKPDSR